MLCRVKSSLLKMLKLSSPPPLFFICFKKDYKLVTLQISYDILELNVSMHLELPLEQS